MYLPSGENATEYIESVYPSKDCFRVPSKFQSLAVLSQLPVSIYLPSGENATEYIQSVCPSKICLQKFFFCLIISTTAEFACLLGTGVDLQAASANLNARVGSVCNFSLAVAAIAFAFACKVCS